MQCRSYKSVASRCIGLRNVLQLVIASFDVLTKDLEQDSRTSAPMPSP